MGGFMRRRISVLVAALLALASSGFTMVWLSDNEAGADDVTQTFACFTSLTNQYSTFPLPVSGEGSPSTVAPGGTTTFSSLDVTFAVSNTVVVEGIARGALDWVTDSALFGSIDPASGRDGVNAVTTTTDAARYTVSNDLVAGVTAAMGSASVRFFIEFEIPDTVEIWVETAPGSWDGSGTDGLVLVPILPVTIALSPDIVATGDGTENDMTLTIAEGPFPANPAGPPTLVERSAAPARFLNNLAGFAANFFCWPGVSQGPIDPVTGLPGPSAGFTPGTSVAIDTVVVDTAATLPPTTTTTTEPPTTTTTTTPPPTTTTTTDPRATTTTTPTPTSGPGPSTTTTSTVPPITTTTGPGPPTTTTTTTVPPTTTPSTPPPPTTTTTTTTIPPTTTTTTTPPVPDVSINDAMAIEGNKGPTKAIINVCLSAPATSTVTVDYATADGTATVADRDYQAKMGTVRFRAGDTCRGITVSVRGDDVVEGPETFDVELRDAVGATIVDGDGEVTIIDDDSLLLGLFR
jgi:hypothetical protein